MSLPDHPSDTELLERFLRSGEAAAFESLMGRYLPLVYSVALRISGNPALAAEVGQEVFLKLVKRPAPLMKGIPFTAWLHRSARSRTIDLMRAEKTRTLHEKMAADFQEMAAGERLPAEALAMLDEVIDRLPANDRKLILQRYFLGESLGAIGQRSGLTEDAVRMRLRRALDKMRALFTARGVSTTAAVLATAMPLQGMVQPPSWLATSISGKAAASVAGGATKISLLKILYLMTTTQKYAIGAASLLAVALVGGTLIHAGSQPETPPADTPANAGTSAEADDVPSKVPVPVAVKSPNAKSGPVADLAAKYGEDPARSAMKLAGQLATLCRDMMQMQSSGPLAERNAEMVKGHFDAFGTSLNLRPEQKEALEKLKPKYLEDLKQQESGIAARLEKNPGAVAETFLAADALSKGTISKNEFDAIYARTRTDLSIGGNSGLDLIGEGIRSQAGDDPFGDFPDLAGEFMQGLDPAQAEKYRDLRRQNADFGVTSFDPVNLDDLSGRIAAMSKMMEGLRLLDH